MRRLRPCSELIDWLKRTARPAIMESGCRQRPISIEAATIAPMVMSPSAVRYTPQMTTVMVDMFDINSVRFDEIAPHSRATMPDCAMAPT